MSDGMKDDTIASSARRWDAARIEAIRLKSERSAFLCERETRKWPPEHANAGTRSTPCWKTFEQRIIGLDDVDSWRLPEEKWCAACRARQVVYLALRDATKRRGVAIRTMQALLATERKRLGLTESYERKKIPVEEPKP